ncbi:MAG: small multi-drug export protein [Candidatus Thermoplasmatota archaeon]|nr:small multi-drug export protein [Candidatus Thermoplasmatota archaeon]MBS3789399.1 small multi-drug export protein [Candidatus Thermoplasmatota archaeon]
MNGDEQTTDVLISNPFGRFFISILPATFAVIIFYFLGPEIYTPAFHVLLTFYFAVGVGWIVAPALALASGMHPLGVVIWLVFISSQSSLIVSANYSLLEKIPWLGLYMERLRKKARNIIEEKELVEKVEYASIFWLMFLPVYGTGPNVMTLVGRLLGLRWKSVWAVITFSACVRFSIITALLYLGYVNI